MSNYLSVAAVTEILKEAIADSVSTVVPGVKVSSLRPKDADTDPPEARVNLYLYQSNPNAAFRNEDLPTRSSGGILRQRPRAVLDLDFLISFYGDHSLLEHQRLMGGVVTLLHAQPLLGPAFIDMIIQKILDNDPTHYLGESDIAEQPESVRLTPIVLNLEETSKIWSVFFQVPHALSIAYRASAVFLEPDSVPRPVLPVRQRNISVDATTGPFIESVSVGDFLTAPVLAGNELTIVGTRLSGEITRVRLDGTEVEAESVTPTAVRFVAPLATTRAGIRGVQVVQRYVVGSVERIRIVSNLASVLVRPAITAVTVDTLNIDPEDIVTTLVTLSVQPEIQPGQRVLLKLNESRSDGQPGQSYVLEATTLASASNDVEFPISGVLSAVYLMRVQVDGADSIVESVDPASEEIYDQPLLNLTVTPPATRQLWNELDLAAVAGRVVATVTVKETVTLPDLSTEDREIIGSFVNATWTLPDLSTVPVSGLTTRRPNGEIQVVFRESATSGNWGIAIDNIAKPGYTHDTGGSQLNDTVTV